MQELTYSMNLAVLKLWGNFEGVLRKGKDVDLLFDKVEVKTLNRR